MTVFTPHQDDALKAVSAWLKARPGKNGDGGGDESFLERSHGNGFGCGNYG